MAQVNTLEDLRAKLDGFRGLLARCSGILVSAALQRDNLRAQGIKEEDVDTPMQAYLDEVEDLIDVLAVDIAALNYKNAVEVFIGHPPNLHHFAHDKAAKTFTAQDINNAAVTAFLDGAGVLFAASDVILIRTPEDADNEGEYTLSAATSSVLTYSNTATNRVTNATDTKMSIRLNQR